MSHEKIPVIAIFDIGKTNKKLFLFDEDYRVVFEKSVQFSQTVDDEGHPCEDLPRLSQWILDSLGEAFLHHGFDIRALNFSAYGASFVLIDHKGKVAAPLYDYLNPFPLELRAQFYDAYSGENALAVETASPQLGNLNSGMQLYRIKYQNPGLFKRIDQALHLPQYFSYLFTGNACSDLTSIGCHTNLWDYRYNAYHRWVTQEGVLEKLAPIVPSDHMTATSFAGHSVNVGVGLHDSSAALLPYLSQFEEPFVLLSTGTWCISLNPFTDAPLTPEELECDALCYLHHSGKPVKASRLFGGHEHDMQVDRLAEFFHTDPALYKTIAFQPAIADSLDRNSDVTDVKTILNRPLFGERDPAGFFSQEQAYHQLVYDLLTRQHASTRLVMDGRTKHIFVDGGFANNPVYMNLLTTFFPDVDVRSASVAQAAAMGAALVIHPAWNTRAVRKDIVDLGPRYHGFA